MSPSLVIALVVFSIVGLVIASFALKIIKLGGIRGVAFGAPIIRTVGEVTRPNLHATVTVRVHILDASTSGNAVGVEFISKGNSTYKSLVMSLPAPVAKELARLLETAANERAIT